MRNTISKYKMDIDNLIKKGQLLKAVIFYECYPEKLKAEPKKAEIIKDLPSFSSEYQTWYSEAKVIIKNLLHDRSDDFQRYYEAQRNRKSIDADSYRIEDYLKGLTVSKGSVNIVDKTAAIPAFEQQLAIVKALKTRFESSLFDIRLHLQGEMFDDELEAAEYLLKNKFIRAAGAMAGVVLERHLKQVCVNHEVKIPKKKNFSISDFNDALKNSDVIDISDWRRIQLLGDFRNNCDHDKKEPKSEEVQELIDGVKKVIKTLF
ncbi:MAG TPA: hypothetical protein PLE74_01390 [Candidatus Cloacimonadota bacterium]|nr:hypothetical protein [Candidatus Cloacimonadota bacterium]HPT70918.1 hypothetical protein [Candidatus Cloacimonadota bacterium]